MPSFISDIHNYVVSPRPIAAQANHALLSFATNFFSILFDSKPHIAIQDIPSRELLVEVYTSDIYELCTVNPLGRNSMGS